MQVSYWYGQKAAVPPRFHRGFTMRRVWKHGPMWHPGASRQGGANEAYLSRCFSVPPPNFNVVDSGVWQLQEDHVFEIEEVIIEIGGVGGESVQEVVWIHSLARCVLILWIEAGKGIWIQQGFGRLIRRPLQLWKDVCCCWCSRNSFRAWCTW